MTKNANPRIRDSVLVFSREQRLQFFCTMELRVKEFDVPAFVPELIQLMDGTRSIEELAETLPTCTPATVEDVAGVVEVLRLEMLLDRARPSLGEETRYARQGLLFEEFIASFPHLPESADELQERLARSRVVIVGMGGAGSWVLQSLVAAGVGNLDIVDPDVVALSNLNRQILFKSDDVGAHKVSVAATRARELNDSAVVRAHRKRVAEVADLEPLLEGASLVINCADEPSVMAASDIVATAAYAQKLPHIVGGAYGGNLGIPGSSVIPGATVCWDCIRAETSNDHGRQDMVAIKGRTRQGGSVAPVAGLVGNFVAWEALKILLDLPLSLANQVRELDLMTLDWRVREVPGRGHCAQCGSLNVDGSSEGATR